MLLEEFQMKPLAITDVQLVADGLGFPEGPVALADGDLLFVQIDRGVLSRVHNGKVATIAELHGGPNGAARGPDGAIYVANNGGRAHSTDKIPPCIQRVDVESGAVETLYVECDGVALAGPNDLVFDRTGSFWFTDMKGGAILYASPDGSSIERVINDADMPNGIGLSPDEGTLYWAQTHTRQVLRRTVSEPGRLVYSGGCTVQAVFRQELDLSCLVIGLPGSEEIDSLAIDAEGNICIGTLVNGGITVVSPDGHDLSKFSPPASFADQAITNICFGGNDLRTAYITLSETGRIISCRWPVPGLPLNFRE
jgi:gluconolactonase